ncbi:MAG: nitrate/nitrite transporter NrtS [Alphaproteobacteria bacterium]
MNDRPSLIHCATRPSVIKSSIIVAVVVGVILNLINQGDALFGDKPIVVWKVLLTFCVPYCVSTYGAVMALRSKG